MSIRDTEQRRRGIDPALRLVQYRHLVHKEGYEWRPERRVFTGDMTGWKPAKLAADDCVLAPRAAAKGRTDAVAERLEPSAYLQFISTPATQDGVLAFANKYGLLGFPDGAGAVAIRQRPGLPVILGAERLQAWQRQLTEMGRAVELWRMIHDARDGRPQDLARHIQWRPVKGGVRTPRYVSGPVPGYAGPAGAHIGLPQTLQPGSPLLASFQQDELVAPALYYLYELVTAHGQLSAKIDSVFTAGSQQEAALFYFPESHLAALWHQFAEAIFARRQCRRCWICRTWMSISAAGTGNRSLRRTCSDKCRTQLRLNRQEAGKLRDEGETLQAIAHKFATDEATVQNWLETAAPKREQQPSPLLLAAAEQYRRRRRARTG